MKKRSLTKCNIATALIQQAVAAVCGLILPRYILRYFGSEVNGLIQTAMQMLSYTVLLEGGLGGVLRAALYKPLANGDNETTSDIYCQIQSTFRKIAAVFLLYAIILASLLKCAVQTQFSWIDVFTLVLILGSGTYINYYMSLPQRLLMTADRKLYVVQSVQTLTTVLNLVVCVSLMRLGAGIHLVKLGTAAVSLIGPLVCRAYVRRNYDLLGHPSQNHTPITQKWDGMIHHLAYFIHKNTDIVLLSLVCGLKQVSVYSAYNVVISVLEQVQNSISSTLASTLGNLLAQDNKDRLNRTFFDYEIYNTGLSFAIATMASPLIVPFVAIHTNVVSDAQYIQPLFGQLMVAGCLMYGIRLPYLSVVSAAGHYKQTKGAAFVEAVSNLTISLLLIFRCNIVGVAIGTFLSISYRTLYTVFYLSKHIMNRRSSHFLKAFIPNLLLMLFLLPVLQHLLPVNAKTISELIQIAIKHAVIVFPCFGVLALLLNKIKK